MNVPFHNRGGQESQIVLGPRGPSTGTLWLARAPCTAGAVITKITAY
jgi:hypothetical protein